MVLFVRSRWSVLPNPPSQKTPKMSGSGYNQLRIRLENLEERFDELGPDEATSFVYFDDKVCKMQEETNFVVADMEALGDELDALARRVDALEQVNGRPEAAQAAPEEHESRKRRKRKIDELADRVAQLEEDSNQIDPRVTERLDSIDACLECMDEEDEEKVQEKQKRRKLKEEEHQRLSERVAKLEESMAKLADAFTRFAEKSV